MNYPRKQVRKNYLHHLSELYGNDEMKAKRIDANQNQIVKCFRDLGASVLILSSLGQGCPDIAVGIHGYTFLFEIKDGDKTPSQRKLTPDEQRFHDEWRGHVGIIKSIDDVIDFVNCIVMLKMQMIHVEQIR